ncbi:hypothetical protein DPM19_00535 [Actinomadura craniellae]|uniref:Protein kinase domain-containing protein n=1 Tax=Actinomadura craniellae TaxID=2231787 RepID=A0A365HCH8_9ACTN|nr:hypothetical protein DPM19_00535 [Actinomadura craniellae]
MGAYEIRSKIGEGGMGAVYLGTAPDGRTVAVKLVRPELSGDPAFLARFRDEVANAERVASFCTAQVLDHGQADDLAYMVTEFIDGPTLAEHVTMNGALSPGMLHGVAVGVAAALVAIHAAGLVHRDLKPGNVLLSISGPRVIDFGIARALDAVSEHTRTGQVVGSPGWIAPEQILNRPVTPAVDVFAWGCLVAYAGNGSHPFGRGTFQVLAARVVHAEPEVGALPEPLGDLVRRALDKEPGNRPSAQELLLALVGGGAAAGGAAAVEEAATTTLHESWRPDEAGVPQPEEPAVPPTRPAPAAETLPAGSLPAESPEFPPPAPAPEAARPAPPPVPAPVEPPRPAESAPAAGGPAGETVADQGPRWSPPPGPPVQPPPPGPPPPGPAVVGFPEQPATRAAGRPAGGNRGRRAALASGLGVVLVAAGIWGVFTMLPDGDKNDSDSSGGPAPLPTDQMLVRVDVAPGWPRECRAYIAITTPNAGAPRRRLVDGDGCDILPQWSPNREQVAFTRVKEGGSELRIVRADGSGETMLSDQVRGKTRVAWSPDGGRIAFMATVAGRPQIHVVDVRSRQVTPLTTDPYGKDDPTWSRDGKLAFWSDKSGTNQIYCLDPAEPQEWTQITTEDTSPNGAGDPIWSPDGQWIGYTRSYGSGQNSDIAVIRRDGSGHRVVETPEHEMDPGFSPNGAWMSFVRGPVETPEIWAMRADFAAPPTASPQPTGQPGADSPVAIGPKGVGHPDWS